MKCTFPPLNIFFTFKRYGFSDFKKLKNGFLKNNLLKVYRIKLKYDVFF